MLKDDVADVLELVKNAEAIVFATPIYYYEMSGQMKTLLDGLNPLYASDYAFREIYLIATAAENEDSAFDKAYNGLQGQLIVSKRQHLKVVRMGGGIDDANSATKHNDIMKDAYRLGTKL